MVLVDSIIRLNPGTLNNRQSAKTDSFSAELLDTLITLDQELLMA